MIQIIQDIALNKGSQGTIQYSNDLKQTRVDIFLMSLKKNTNLGCMEYE